MLDLRQTPEYAKYMSSIGWIVERKNGVIYFIKKIPIIGSFIKIQRPEKIDYQYIDVLAVKYRAFQIVIEPLNKNHVSSIKYHGHRQSKTPFVPAKTIHIDLTKSEKTLLKEMHYKTRYNIKKINHQSLTIIHSKDIKSFADFWQKCALKQRGMFLFQKNEIVELHNAFGKNSHLILTYHKDTSDGGRMDSSEVDKREIISGILMIITNDIAYYMYAASSDKGKRLFAPTLNAWESIKLAKKLGCKIFDFEGIYDDRFPLKSWKGFTRFKKSFGGKEIEFPGAFVKYRLPF
jgi:lipid II:glycine glycyltransferase (peptidoglycan interpeptide bridge formation enzyme)